MPRLTQATGTSGSNGTGHRLRVARLEPVPSNHLDWSDLQEEPEALGRLETWKLVSRFDVLLSHLPKWELQSDRCCRSWFCSIREQRRAIGRLFRISARRTLTTHPAVASHPEGRAK